MASRILGLTMIATLLTPLPVAAQPRQAAVSVVAFDIQRGVKLSRQDRDALADDLATRLVESGRYRVLEREWLPLPIDAGDSQPLAILREAARSAGVEYLVLGSVTRMPPARTSRPRMVASVARMLVTRQPTRGPVRGCYPRPARNESLSVEVRVVDVESGEVRRTSVASSGGPLWAEVGAGWIGGGCGAKTTATKLAGGATGSRLAGLQRANARIADTLVLPDPKEDQ
jgi:curli biogenesis system outer membrane secretion channel CsgG